MNGILFRVRGLEANTSTRFRWELCQLAFRQNLDPTALASVMSIETGGTFSPSIKNPGSSHTGLIQFSAQTARQLGTTTEALARMSAVEQLVYVERFFAPVAARIHEPRDHYMATAAPAHIGAPPEKVIYTGSVAAANPGLDRDHDGGITAGEIYAVFQPVYDAALAAGPADVGEPPSSSTSPEDAERRRAERLDYLADRVLDGTITPEEIDEYTMLLEQDDQEHRKRSGALQLVGLGLAGIGVALALSRMRRARG